MKPAFLAPASTDFDENAPHAAEQSGSFEAEVFAVAHPAAGVVQNPTKDDSPDGMTPQRFGDLDLGGIARSERLHRGSWITQAKRGVADRSQQRSRIVHQRGRFQLQLFQAAVAELLEV